MYICIYVRIYIYIYMCSPWQFDADGLWLPQLVLLGGPRVTVIMV